MTSQLADDHLGKMAYDAYYHQHGVPDEPWDGLPRAEQEAWIAAARTIELYVEAQGGYDPHAHP